LRPASSADAESGKFFTGLARSIYLCNTGYSKQRKEEHMDTTSAIPTAQDPKEEHMDTDSISQQDKQITVDVPEDRVPEFYAWYARFLANERGPRRRGRGGPGGPRGRHGHGPGRRCGHHGEPDVAETERPAEGVRHDG
jgi:hypothetical protein